MNRTQEESGAPAGIRTQDMRLETSGDNQTSLQARYICEPSPPLNRFGSKNYQVKHSNAPLLTEGRMSIGPVKAISRDESDTVDDKQVVGRKIWRIVPYLSLIHI